MNAPAPTAEEVATCSHRIVRSLGKTEIGTDALEVGTCRSCRTEVERWHFADMKKPSNWRQTDEPIPKNF